jgi:hypothetical protein
LVIQFAAAGGIRAGRLDQADHVYDAVRLARRDWHRIAQALTLQVDDVTSDGLVKRFADANVAKSVINALLIDSDEEWERMELRLTNFDRVMQRLGSLSQNRRVRHRYYCGHLEK